MMASAYTYGLTGKQLEEATLAAQAVAARLAHIVINTEWWGRVEIAPLFLNMTLLRTLPHPESRRKMYHRVCRPLFEGLDALDLDTMPADQREAVQQVRDYRAWRIEADRQHESRKAQPG